MGRWMKGKDRRPLVIATKCRGRMWGGPNGEGASRKHVFEAVEDSLRRLQTDYIDLYQIHWPDPDTPAEETVRALDDLVRQGKIRYFGWSNHDAAQIEERARVSDRLGLNRAVSLQNYYNMLGRGVEETVTPRCAEEGLGSDTLFASGTGPTVGQVPERPRPPRAAGRRATRTSRSGLEKELPKLKALAAFAREHEATLSQLALAWLLHQPTMASPIIGATSAEQMTENVKAVDVKLSQGDLGRIDTILSAPEVP